MTEWGDWKLVNEPIFMLVNEKHFYEVSFSDMNSSAQILDWIFQLYGKTWMTEKSMHDFLTAVDSVLMPQAFFCSGGVDHPADGARLAEKYWSNPSPFRFLDIPD